MTAQVIYGTDFKRSNPKADRAFWIGAEKPEVETVPEQFRYADTAPSDIPFPFVAPDGDCA